MDLNGKVAIVTGGAQGIGRATVERFVQAGALGVTIADIQDQEATNCANQIMNNYGGSIISIPTDVTQPDQVQRMVQATLERTVSGFGLKVSRLAMKERSLAISPPLDPKIVGPIEKIAAKHFAGVPVIPEMSTGASDATHLGRIGIPTYGVPGLWNEPETAGTHGLNERIYSNSLYLGRDYLFDLIRYFAGS